MGFVIVIIGLCMLYSFANAMFESNLFYEILNLLIYSISVGGLISALCIEILEIKRKKLIIIAVCIGISTIFFYSLAYMQENFLRYDIQMVSSKEDILREKREEIQKKEEEIEYEEEEKAEKIANDIKDLYAFKEETKDSAKKLRYQINTYINENQHIENSKIGQLIYIKLTFEDLTQNEIEYINKEIENTLGFIVEKSCMGYIYGYAIDELKNFNIVDEDGYIYQRNNSMKLEEIKSILDNSSYGLAFGKVDIVNSNNRVNAYIHIEKLDYNIEIENFYQKIK